MVRLSILLLLMPGTFLRPPVAVAPAPPGEIRQETESLHEAWNLLLKKYVDEKGLVDYRGFEADSTALNAYLNALMKNVPGDGSGKEDRLAFYINFYNAATVKLILRHYPIKSIRDIKAPWDTNWIPLNGSLRSLGYLEHQILRKMGEPRIHFAINCASNSCPKLLNTAYTPGSLEAQLREATRGFIMDTTRNRIGSERLELSQIFNWYKKDFVDKGSPVAYISRYTDIHINPDAKITYLRYDWNLNEQP